MGKKYKADKISIGGHTLDADRMVILDSVIEGGAHSEAGYISSFTDTNTHLTDAEIAAMGYIKTYTDTNTNTQLSQAQVGAYAVDEGFIKTYTDTNTQLTSAQIAEMGYLTALPSHNHDDRYYTEAESNSRFINVTGDTMSGSLDVNADIQANTFTQAAHGIPRNNLGAPTVTEMALFDNQFTPKTTLANNYDNLTDLTFWVQTTSSSAWTEITTFSDDQKRKFLRTNNSNIAIPNGVYKFRVEFVGQGYTFANAMYAYWSSNSHNTSVHVWKYNVNSSSWLQHTNSSATISSWPGHMYLPFSTIPWLESATTHTGHFKSVRIEFTPTWSTGTYSDRVINLYGMQVWGGYPSGRRTPHYYDQNGRLNVTKELSVSDNIRTPLLYDLNNTSYYLDPASTSNLNVINATGGTSTEWNTAHGWGNHADAGYITTDNNTTYNFAGSTFTSRNSGNPIAIDSATSNMSGYTNSSAAAGFADGGLFVAAYSTSWVSQIFSNFRTGELSTRGKNSGTWQAWRTIHDSGHFSTTDVANGVTAHGWGNHADEGYLTSYTDTNTTYDNTDFVDLTSAQTVGGIKTFTSDMVIKDGSPTLGFADTDANNDDFYIHVNSNNFYVLADRDDSGLNNGISGWDGSHPLQLESDTNKAYTFGNEIYHTGNLPTIPSGNSTIDWTTDQGGTNIHSGNYTNTDTNTQLTTAQIAAMGYIKENEDRTHKVLRFTGESGNSNNSAQSYAIYQESGAWTHPYPDLVIGYHTGIKIGGHQNYNGTRFYSDAPGRNGAVELMSVGNGDGDVRVTNVAHAGNSFRAPYFYSPGDTTYFLDPASSSVLFSVSAQHFYGNLTGNASTATLAATATTATTATNVAWSGITSKPASWLDSNVLIQDKDPSDSAFPSGFYQKYQGNGPTGTWFNYINVRHSNAGNGHGYQAGMSYYDNNFWFRSYQGGTAPTFQTWEHALSSGSGHQTKTGILQSNASLRAPIFYDSNDTSYYVDAGSTTQLNHLSVNSTFKSRNFTAGSLGYQLENRSAGGATFRFDGDTFIFYGGGGVGNVFEMNQNGDLTARTSLHAPIFYDSDNTGYYVNPASTSSLNELTVNGTIAGNISGNANTLDNINSTSFLRSDAGDSFSGTLVGGAQRMMEPNDYGKGVYGKYSSTKFQHVWGMGSSWHLDASGSDLGNFYGLAYTHSNVGTGSQSGFSHQTLFVTGGQVKTWIGSGVRTVGDLISDTSVKAPIFYDSNNTGYYLNPASTSNLNVLTLAGTATASNFILSSDERKKTKIKDLPRDNINTNWKSFEMKNDEGEYRTGVIAQELEETHPEFVNTDPEGFKSVKYIDLLIAKIAELEARLEKLEK